jgi:hypothetical protein
LIVRHRGFPLAARVSHDAFADGLTLSPLSKGHLVIRRRTRQLWVGISPHVADGVASRIPSAHAISVYDIIIEA